MEPNVGALIYFLKRVFLIAYFDIYTLVTFDVLARFWTFFAIKEVQEMYFI